MRTLGILSVMELPGPYNLHILLFLLSRHDQVTFYLRSQHKPTFFLIFLPGWRGLQIRSSNLSMWRPCPSGWGRFQPTWWETWLSWPPCCPDWAMTPMPIPPTMAGLTPRSWTTPDGWVLTGSFYHIWSSFYCESHCLKATQWSIFSFIIWGLERRMTHLNALHLKLCQ